MDVWPWLIFGVAAMMALRVLAGLMTAERDRLLHEAAARAAAEQAQQDEREAESKKGRKSRNSPRREAA